MNIFDEFQIYSLRLTWTKHKTENAQFLFFKTSIIFPCKISQVGQNATKVRQKWFSQLFWILIFSCKFTKDNILVYAIFSSKINYKYGNFHFKVELWFNFFY